MLTPIANSIYQELKNSNVPRPKILRYSFFSYRDAKEVSVLLNTMGVYAEVLPRPVRHTNLYTVLCVER